MPFGLRSVLATAGIAAVALFGGSAAYACGNGGYAYAGIASSTHTFGISASITPLPAFSVVSGHVAGWVGVGGPHQGPNGADEWLQAGYSNFPWADGSSLYYELMLPNGRPVYHEIATGLPSGREQRLAVLEIKRRPDWWRVWLNGSPASAPILLPGSHGRWAGTATAESWDGGTGGACNGFLYRFDKVQLAQAPGGSWKPLAGGYPITSPAARLAHKGRSFLAAAGHDALRTLATLSR
jgi:hypothetical protein